MRIVGPISRTPGMSLSSFVPRSIALFAVGVLLSGCPGDPGYAMRIENQTTVTVTVYELGAYPRGSEGFLLSPGAYRYTDWLRPREGSDDPPTVVKAVDGSGALVFCRPYSYDTARDNFRWTLAITPGVNECTPEQMQ